MQGQSELSRGLRLELGSLFLHCRRAQDGAGPSDVDILLRKLVEAEIDGEAAAKQVAALRDLIGQLKKVSPDS